MNIYDLSGVWQCRINDEVSSILLPGTLDEAGIGHRDMTAEAWHPDAVKADGEYFAQSDCISTRFTRKVTYEGAAVLTKKLKFSPPQGSRVFLECERARHLTLFLNGQAVPHFNEPNITTPHIFEVTGLLNGDDDITLISDNSYPGWPRENILYSSAATNETQTNWNGILGYIRLRIERDVFISDVRVLPYKESLTLAVKVSAESAWRGKLTAVSSILKYPAEFDITAESGESEHIFPSLPLGDDVHRWDIDDGYMYDMTVTLEGGDSQNVSFGVRNFETSDGKFILNGRTVFLRSEANCAVFPETGHSPMSVEEWTEILKTYRSYGVNCMRFHSHCPPEAAFTAADRLGILMQPELSHWNPRNAFETDESFAYYRVELMAILRYLSNHPSFVMLTLGNELQASECGHARMESLLRAVRTLDSTRLYADGSNNHYGWYGCSDESDFYTSSNYYELPLRATNSTMAGWLNEEYPDMRHSYDRAIESIRQKCDKPVVSFEVGQYEVLPDFDELDDFHGVTEPANYKLIRSHVNERGLAESWKRQVEATGEISLLCYRAETEAAMRTTGMAGISLLGLQDFPGQGTALVGMLNSHLKPKPFSFAEPQRFGAFFRDVLPLVLLPKYTFSSNEVLSAKVKLFNYGKEELRGRMRCSLNGDGINIIGDGEEVCAPCGELTLIGAISIPLSNVLKPSKLTLSVEFCGSSNEYNVWVYPDVTLRFPEDVYKCAWLDEKAEAVLASGGKVYISPPSTKTALPKSIKAQFSTDFWSVGTFPKQEGGMGQLIDASHPIFKNFPTDTHTNWQWWAMASRRAVILPRQYDSIITEMDSYAYLRPMAQLFECRCGEGKVLFSSLGLDELLEFPECRALQNSICRYMDSDEFEPVGKMTVEELRSLAVPI